MVCSSCGATTVRTDACDACGADPRLAGRWMLVEEVGSGAFGTTWRATDEQTGDTVAIKEMLVRRANAVKCIELFEREARILETLDHPGIPRFHADLVRDAGRNSAFYLVQEFIDGPTLEALHGGRPIVPERAFRYGLQLLEILRYLHSFSPPVVHRDVKPGNVMVRADGSLVLIDFGSVRAALDTATGGSTVAGTFGYMAPEQFMGRAVPRTDIYGVGATLVALLSADDPQKLQGTLRAIDPTPLGLAEPMMRALRRMLAPEDGDRPGVDEAIRLVRAALDPSVDAPAAPRAPKAPAMPTVHGDASGEAESEATPWDPALDVFVEYPEMSTARLTPAQRRAVEQRRFKDAVLNTRVVLPDPPMSRLEESGRLPLIPILGAIAVVAAFVVPIVAQFEERSREERTAASHEANRRWEESLQDSMRRTHEREMREFDRIFRGLELGSDWDLLGEAREGLDAADDPSSTDEADQGAPSASAESAANVGEGSGVARDIDSAPPIARP
jgi:hypothetical protein